MSRRIVVRCRSRHRRNPLAYWGFTVLTVVAVLVGNVPAAAVTATLAYCLKPQIGERRR